jgi:hypothetical protein
MANRERIILATIFLVFSVAGTIFFTNLHTQHLHNIDLAFNALNNPELMEEIYDMYEVGESKKLSYFYVDSMEDMWHNHYYVAIFAYLSGMSLALLLTYVKLPKEKKKEDKVTYYES